MLDGLLQYNKNISDRRRPLIMTSPLSRQLKVKADAIATPIMEDLAKRLNELTEEMMLLKKEGDSVAIVGTSKRYYTEEEFNDELIKALEKELKHSKTPTDKKLVSRINELEEEVKKLEKELEIKDAIINTLKTLEIKTKPVDNVDVYDNIQGERPDIDTTIIDPTENVSLENHIVDKVETPSNSINKQDLANKLGALKDILGG